MAKIKVTMMISSIAALKNHKANLAALGLHKVGESKIHEDNAVIRGMIRKVAHMVKVENAD